MTPEEAAMKLFEMIATVEKKAGTATDAMKTGYSPMDRKWILDTYAECLTAVKHPHDRAE